MGLFSLLVKLPVALVVDTIKLPADLGDAMSSGENASVFKTTTKILEGADGKQDGQP